MSTIVAEEMVHAVGFTQAETQSTEMKDMFETKKAAGDHDLIVCQFADFLEVNPEQGYTATKMKILSCARPHMVSFHMSWLSFFVAFLGWFALAPLMPVIKKDLGLTESDVWTANITSVLTTVFARFLIGPMCDEYGPRRLQTGILLWGACATALCPLINSASSLIVIRLFIGVVGSTFVPTQYWGSSMFASNIVGQAQAISGGWGNTGGGVTQLFMPLMFEAMKAGGASDGAAWRLALIIPSVLLFLTAAAIFIFSNDCPRGDFVDLVKAGTKAKVSATSSAKKGYGDPASWVLAAQYAGCFGVELTVNNSMTSYFVNKFGLGLVSAGSIASCFGLMNLFARALGGILSDYANKKLQMRGRLIAQMFCLFFEGIMLVIFSRMETVASAVPMLICFSVFVQSAEGTTYAIVPSVVPEAKGAVTGVVGAGGNMGAVCWGLIFLFSGFTPSDCYMTIGFIVMGLSLLTPLIFLKGNHDSVFGYNPRKTLVV
mmetsp:Transcript_31471/g.63933  ORF Transcript_31471/g.63933 Transcript_31471/m.63933 type:complete len:489 (+) Transcript_31471:491-1957(+)